LFSYSGASSETKWCRNHKHWRHVALRISYSANSSIRNFWKWEAANFS